MKTLFAAVALLAMFAPVSLAVGQQDYPPQQDQQYQQQPGPQQQPDPYQGGYQQPDSSQSYPPSQDQSQGGYRPPPPDASQGDYQQAPADAQQGGDQVSHDSAGGYSADSAGQDRARHAPMCRDCFAPQLTFEKCRGIPPYPYNARNDYNEWPTGPNSIVIAQHIEDSKTKVFNWFVKALPGWKFVDYDAQHYYPPTWEFQDGPTWRSRKVKIYWWNAPHIDVTFVCPN